MTTSLRASSPSDPTDGAPPPDRGRDVARSNTRRHPRASLDTLVHLKADQGFEVTRSVDLSAGGVQLLSDLAFDVGTVVETSFEPPGWGHRLFLRGEVVRLEAPARPGAGPHGVCLHFLDLAPDDGLRLDWMLRRRLARDRGLKPEAIEPPLDPRLRARCQALERFQGRVVTLATEAALRAEIRDRISRGQIFVPTPALHDRNELVEFLVDLPDERRGLELRGRVRESLAADPATGRPAGLVLSDLSDLHPGDLALLRRLVRSGGQARAGRPSPSGCPPFVAELLERVEREGDVLLALPASALLGLSPTPTLDELKEAYFRELGRYQPERYERWIGPEARERLERLVVRVDQAYRQLLTEVERRSRRRPSTPTPRIPTTRVSPTTPVAPTPVAPTPVAPTRVVPGPVVPGVSALRRAAAAAVASPVPGPSSPADEPSVPADGKGTPLDVPVGTPFPLEAATRIADPEVAGDALAEPEAVDEPVLPRPSFLEGAELAVTNEDREAAISLVEAGEAALGLSQADVARRCFEEALTHDRYSARAHFGRAIALLQEGKSDPASLDEIECGLARAVDLDPDDERYALGFARQLRARGEVHETRAIYLRLLQRRADHPEALEGLAWCDRQPA